MKTYLFLVMMFASFFVFAQTKEYVCVPCGNACDKEIYFKPGSCSSCHMKLIEKTSIQFENLSTDAFCQRIITNPKCILLDVRSKAEFEGTEIRHTFGHFKNAININVDDLENRMSELSAYKDREILVYCSHSVRSPRAALMLTENGFKNVKNMDGGVSTLQPNGNDCLKRTYVIH